MASDGNNQVNQEKTFISYFQKVLTIGIVSKGKTAKEAQTKSSKKLKNSELSCGVVAETKFQPTATEEWAVDLPKA